MRDIDTFIIHCAATKADMDIGATEIDQWHQERGWDGIGYHYVIRRNGRVERGRRLDKVGAHAKGHNTGSIGICMVGGIDDSGEAEDNFTTFQWGSLQAIVTGLAGQFPQAKIIGHYEVNPDKACPSFDVAAWLARNPV